MKTEKMRCYPVFDLFLFLFHANTFYCQKLIIYFFLSFFLCDNSFFLRLLFFWFASFFVSYFGKFPVFVQIKSKKK